LALFSGGMLPIISLSFLHMLVKFEEEEKKKEPTLPTNIDIDELSIEAGKIEAKYVEDKYVPTEEELKRLEVELFKLNEQKFGILEGPIGSEGPDDTGLNKVELNEPEKKVLNYSKRND
jgi:hypothetical protein